MTLTNPEGRAEYVFVRDFPPTMIGRSMIQDLFAFWNTLIYPKMNGEIIVMKKTPIHLTAFSKDIVNVICVFKGIYVPKTVDTPEHYRTEAVTYHIPEFYYWAAQSFVHLVRASQNEVLVDDEQGVRQSATNDVLFFSKDARFYADYEAAMIEQTRTYYPEDPKVMERIMPIEPAVIDLTREIDGKPGYSHTPKELNDLFEKSPADFATKTNLIYDGNAVMLRNRYVELSAIDTWIKHAANEMRFKTDRIVDLKKFVSEISDVLEQIMAGKAEHPWLIKLLKDNPKKALSLPGAQDYWMAMRPKMTHLLPLEKGLAHLGDPNHKLFYKMIDVLWPERKGQVYKDMQEYLEGKDVEHEEKFLLVDVYGELVGVTGYYMYRQNVLGLAWHGILPEHRQKNHTRAAIYQLIDKAKQKYPHIDHFAELIPADKEEFLGPIFERLDFKKTGAVVEREFLPKDVYWYEYIRSI